MPSPYVYISNGGRVVCPTHGGMYLQEALRRRPEARMITTPLDVWERFTDGETFDGFTLQCETCHPYETEEV